MKKDEKFDTKMNVYCHSELKRRLKKLAQKKNLDFSSLVRIALYEKLESEEKAK